MARAESLQNQVVTRSSRYKFGANTHRDITRLVSSISRLDQPAKHEIAIRWCFRGCKALALLNRLAYNGKTMPVF
jgi:hypothetical protein